MEAQNTAARVQSQLQDMQKTLEQWQGQYGDLKSHDLGQAVLDAGRSGGPPLEVPDSGWARGGAGEAQVLTPVAPITTVSSLEKTLPQLLAKLSLLENRGGRNASLALSASISCVRELIAQARGAASQVGHSAGQWGVWETA